MSIRNVRAESNDLVFDGSDPRCKCIVHNIQGTLFAFIQVMDLGAEHCRFDEPMPKYYCGHFDDERPQESILAIMKTGSKWPHLPPHEDH